MKSRISDTDFRTLALIEHQDAPPCVQKMYEQGVAQGHRNEGLYNITVYLKKLSPEGYEGRAAEANSTIFSKPLPRTEMLRTINSASRPECGYRCNEEPVRSLCDRQTCMARKFGITSADAERMDTVDSLPLFSEVTKFLTEPVRWSIKIDGQTVTNISTEQLLDWRWMRVMAAERLTKVVPLIKNQEWERLLQPLMREARIVDAPDDASVSGAMRERLREFAAKCDLVNDHGTDKEARKSLLRGLPCIQVVDSDRCVVFRGQDFIAYLKRTRSEELKGVNLWFAVKDMGVRQGKMRIKDQLVNVWHIPVNMVQQAADRLAEPETFESEI
jgi:hypothetical protein